ncbi:MAG: hypothetical protein U5J64_02485 [Halobacteriales archaeon]|nr:hypothetical protein [Halobacteriales archaeon]
MSKTRTASLVVLVVSLLLLTAGAGAFTSVKSQRVVDIYSDDNPGTFIDFEVDDRDATACGITFDVSNNLPSHNKTVKIDGFNVAGNGFDAWASSVPHEPIGVGETAEVEIRVEDGYVGRGTLDIEMEMSGRNVEISLDEESWVYCEEPEEEDEEEEEGDNGRERGGGPPSNPPGRR